jgi:uridylate kinase
MGKSSYGINPEILSAYAEDIKVAVSQGVQIGIVIGGGNIFRGISGVDKGFDRVKGDSMGMLATVINSIAVQSALENINVKAKVLTSINMEPVGEYYSKQKAVDAMNNGYVVIIAGGTGNPFFTTDSASALRAVEIEADVLLKGTRVDGVYTADPEKDKSATKFDEITFDEAYSKGLKIMDLTAFTMCKENDMPIIVFDMNTRGNVERIVKGEKIGTIVKN